MNFDDIIDILFEGTKEEMQNLECPQCGGKISYDIGQNNVSMRIQCIKCGSRVNLGKLAEIPNCLAEFGNICVLGKK